MMCGNCGSYITDEQYWNNSRCWKCGALVQMWQADENAEPRLSRLGGYLPDPAEGGARIEMKTETGQLPRQVDLRPGCTAIEDQGAIGSCTANAAVGALEYHRKRVGLEQIDLSRMFVYYNTRRLRGDIDNDTGATIGESMAAVLAYGAPDARLWPYEPAKFKEQPPAQAYESAFQNEAIEFARVTPREGVWAALAAGYPVCFGCFLPSGAYQAAARDGSMPAPTEQQWLSEDKGGHAMLLVGYDLDREIYIVRNSWSAQYGDQGYLYIPFSVMDRGGHPESFWVIGKLEQETGFKVVRPAETASGAAPSLSVGGEAAGKLREQIRSDIKADLGEMRKGLRDRLTKKD